VTKTRLNNCFRSLRKASPAVNGTCYGIWYCGSSCIRHGRRKCLWCRLHRCGRRWTHFCTKTCPHAWLVNSRNI